MGKEPELSLQDTFFHCPKCGSLRIAGARLHALNYLPDPAGRMRPTVKQSEIDRIKPQFCETDHYVAYCFNRLTTEDGVEYDCGFVDRVYTPDMVARHHPEQAS